VKGPVSAGPFFYLSLKNVTIWQHISATLWTWWKRDTFVHFPPQRKRFAILAGGEFAGGQACRALSVSVVKVKTVLNSGCKAYQRRRASPQIATAARVVGRRRYLAGNVSYISSRETRNWTQAPNDRVEMMTAARKTHSPRKIAIGCGLSLQCDSGLGYTPGRMKEVR
jgi:hypothetical protein